MNWLAILALVINATIAIVAVYTNEQKRKAVHIFLWRPTFGTLYYLLIIGLLIVSTASVVYQEIEQNTKDLASSYQGELQSNSWPVFSTYQNKYPCMEIGDSGVAFEWSGQNDQPLFQILNTPLFISNNDGQIKLTANLRGRDGSIAVLDNSEWLVNPSQMTRNYNKDILEVYDKYHDTVLQIRLLKDRIQLQGKFYDEKGNGVAIVGQKSWHGCIFEQTGSTHSKLNSTIEPIFGLQFGEVRHMPEDSLSPTIYSINESLILGRNPEGNVVFIDAVVHTPLNDPEAYKILKPILMKYSFLPQTG